MKYLGRYALAATIAIAAIANVASEAEAKKRKHHDHPGEIIAAGIIGVVIGGALASEHSHDRVYYRRRPVPVYDGGGDDYGDDYSDNYGDYGNGYSGDFSPVPGVVCYEDQQVCYNGNGSYAHRWMKRMFHRRH